MKQKVDENRKQKGSTHLVTFVPRILAFRAGSSTLTLVSRLARAIWSLPARVSLSQLDRQAVKNGVQITQE